jgi:hypothetical protein
LSHGFEREGCSAELTTEKYVISTNIMFNILVVSAEIGSILHAVSGFIWFACDVLQMLKIYSSLYGNSVN